jgi:hypothetical protein
VIAHHRKRDAFPITFEERSAKPSQVATSFGFGFDEPAVFDESPNEMLNDAWSVKTCLPHVQGFDPTAPELLKL